MKEKLKKIRQGVFELEKEGRMNVPLRFYATQPILDALEEGALQQGINVASLPGIQLRSIMLPDAHFGYGFPIGGVAAFDANDGIISPGGIGFDINCGVRILATPLKEEDVKPKMHELIDKLFKAVPSGVGSKGKLKISESELDNVLQEGARWAVEKGYGWEEDLERCEENGCIEGADPEKVSHKAKERGRPQLGTLGSGNHFLEIQKVDKIFDPAVAKVFGIKEEGQITVMIHCGSRGLGHQVASDYIHVFDKVVKRLGIKLVDRQLVYSPLTEEGAWDYIKAMFGAVNYAFANRHIIMHWVREVFGQVFGREVMEDMKLVYDVCHNIGKLEEHNIEGKKKKVWVHRKGATRAFPKDHPLVPRIYRSVGQPVLIPGSMGTASYILIGTENALEETFGSTAHGAGRVMSRARALRTLRGESIIGQLERRGISIRAASKKVVAEEAPLVYKDVDEVVRATELAGISRKVARMVPLGVVKG